MARRELRGKATPQSVETKTRSSTLRTGSDLLLDQVKRAPTRVISLRARSAMQSLNILMRGTSTLQELLSSGERIRLKSPATTTGMEQLSTLVFNSSKKAGDREWSAGP